MPISTAGKGQRNSQRGFTYAVVLVAAVILGIVAETAVSLDSLILQRDREAELLFRGQAYLAAIKSYYSAGGTFPRALSDLVNDPRSANRHHIRALYTDPMGNDPSGWRVVTGIDGGISGVASRSNKEPLKKAGFPPGLEKFEGAKTYSDWVFEYVPPRAASGPGTSPAQPVVGPPVLKTN